MDDQRLPGTIVVAIVFLWINVAVAVGIVVLGRLAPSEVLLSVVWGIAYAAIALGLQARQSWARPVGLVVTLLSYLIGLVTHGTFLSTTLVAFILLAIPVRSRPARLSTPDQLVDRG